MDIIVPFKSGNISESRHIFGQLFYRAFILFSNATETTKPGKSYFSSLYDN